MLYNLNESICQNCRHFHQHYIYSYGQYVGCNCGHCVMPRTKPRKPNQTCEWFMKRY